MENIGRIIKNPEVRKYIYVVAIATIPLLVAYGIINEKDVDNITVFIGAVLGLGTTALAVANTPSTGVDNTVENSVEPEEDEVIDVDPIEEIESKVVDLEQQGLLSEEESVAKDAIKEISEVKGMLSEILETLYSQTPSDDDELKGE